MKGHSARGQLKKVLVPVPGTTQKNLTKSSMIYFSCTVGIGIGIGIGISTGIGKGVDRNIGTSTGICI